MPVYTPIAPPAVPDDAQKPADLTVVQADLHAKVLGHFSTPEYALPEVEKSELTEDEKFWLSYECISRYLRAVKWASAEKAIQRIERTLKWRREYGLYDLVTPAYVEPEAVTGKAILFGFDTNRRPAFYMIPSRQNTTKGARQLQFTVWMLERAIDLMGPGVEAMDLLINVADGAVKNPSLRTVCNILRDHYPKRLGLALVINIPFPVDAFFKLMALFKLIKPFLRHKIRFNPDVVQEGIFKPNMTMKRCWDGDQDFVYEHDKYWSVLVEMCEARKKAQLERWRTLGGKVGLKEWDYKFEALDPETKDEKALETVVAVNAVAETVEATA